MTLPNSSEPDLLKEHWDRLWDQTNSSVPLYTIKERLDDPIIGIRHSRLLKDVLFYLGQMKRPLVLEAGCGQGIWVIELESNGYKVVGIDYSMKGIHAALEYGVSSSIINGNILSLPFKDNSFDVILSWGVVEHFQDVADVLSALHEKWRVIRQGGVLFITVPVDNYFLRLKNLARRLPVLSCFAQPDPPFFEHHFRPSQFLQILRGSGFDISSWRYHASDYGLATSIPLLFQKKLDRKRYYGLNLLGKVVHSSLVRWLPSLTAQMIFVIARRVS
jgi:2-polyprenyl-3-methyl-5-hydroxy-6-metoxy-1,4-benzoquinol methylase